MPYNPDIHHRHSVRLRGYDYSQEGWYFVTICVQKQRANATRPYIFGEIIDGKMVLNNIGKIAHDEWMKTPIIRPEIEMGEFIVMPNHIHGIIAITTRRGVSNTPLLHTTANAADVLATSDNRDNTSIQHLSNEHQGVCDTPLRSPSNTIGAIVRGYKSAVTKKMGYPIWQRNYYEHIIRDAQSYHKITEYIIGNPAKWIDDKFYKE
ncbi:hypothetical protein AGMMS4956_13090 [Bacteroidia bacterium]|nr:hypothetical protein AGMMS4956_13090 [Bacteroidia bacterium]